MLPEYKAFSRIARDASRKWLDDGKVDSPDAGLCTNFNLLRHDGGCEHISTQEYRDWRLNVLVPIMNRWPFNTGDESYPVPGDDEVARLIDLDHYDGSASLADRSYHAAIEAGLVYDRDYKYGRMRWDLLEFIHEELTREVGDGLRAKLLPVLVALRDGTERPRAKCGGICTHTAYGLFGPFALAEDEAELDDLLQPMFSTWPEYSGERVFPVPSGVEGVTAHDAYMGSNDCWDRETPYGQARWRLVDHLIQCLEAEL